MSFSSEKPIAETRAPTPISRSKHERACLFILGMHRSGTSSIAGTLVKLGATAPTHLMGASPGNETGHWESRALMEFNDELLASAGSRWDDWRRFNPAWKCSSVGMEFKSRAKALLSQEFGNAPLFAFKDPRNCRFADFWLDVFADQAIKPKVVLPIRSPLEVAQSHRARDGFPLRKGLLLWLRHVLDAEFASRGLPRHVIEWDAFLNNWQASVTAIEEALGVFLANSDLSAAKVDRFLTVDLKHQRVAPEDLTRNALVHDWIEQAYAALKVLARDPSSNRACTALDEVRESFNVAAALFGGVLADVEVSLTEVEERLRAAEATRQDAMANLASLQLEVDTERAKTAIAVETAHDALRAEVGRLEQALGDEQRQTLALKAEVVQRDQLLQSAREQSLLTREQMETLSRETEALRASYQQALEDLKNSHSIELASIEASQFVSGDNLIEIDKRIASIRETIHGRSTEPLGGVLTGASVAAVESNAISGFAKIAAEVNQLDDDVESLATELETARRRVSALERSLSSASLELRSSLAELYAERRTVLKPLLRNMYASGGRALRLLLSEASVARLRRRLPHPDGVPNHLATMVTRVDDMPSDSVADVSPAIGEKADVFIFSIIGWDFRVQRPQHLARLLAETGRRVFYVEMEQVAGAHSVRRIGSNLYVVRLSLDLVGLLPAYQAGARQRQVAAWLRTLYGFCDSVGGTIRKDVIIQHPYWWQLLRGLSPDFKLVFDCMDDIAGFSNTSAEILALENEMIDEVDSLVVSSQYLHAKNAHRAPVMVRNATQIEHFRASDVPRQMPTFLKERGFDRNNGRVKVGYIGAISDWYDVELLRTVAQGNPDIELHLCGGVTNARAASLAEFENITLYGEIPYADAPAFLDQMDVATIPFRLLPIIEACDPVKFYEHCAAGIATVSTRLPELERARDLVFFASDADEFAKQIRVAAGYRHNAEFRSKLMRYAEENTWNHRANQFAAVLDTAPLVSIVILSFGQADLTKAAVHSLSRGCGNYENSELIIVDNGSDAATLADLESFVAGIPNATLIKNGANLGFAAGNNVGIRASKGEFIFLLNNDTYAAPGAIRALVRHLQRSPDIGVVGPMTNNIGNEARVAVNYGNMDQMYKVARELTTGHRGQWTTIRVAAYFAAMFRREDFKRFGLLPERYGQGMFEDDDHCEEIRSKGFVCALAEDAFVHHHLSASFSVIGSEAKQRLFQENRRKFEELRGPWIPHRYRDLADRPASTVPKF